MPSDPFIDIPKCGIVACHSCDDRIRNLSDYSRLPRCKSNCVFRPAAPAETFLVSVKVWHKAELPFDSREVDERNSNDTGRRDLLIENSRGNQSTLAEHQQVRIDTQESEGLMTMSLRRWVIACGLWLACSTGLWAAETAQLLKTIKAVDREGKGNAAAAEALQELTQQGGQVLPTILEAFDDANPLAANWLRSAVETIADREVKQGRPLPTGELERFVLDVEQNPQARRLAYEWLNQVDESAKNRLIPNMLHDPSPEFRRDSVQRLMTEAEKLEEQEKTEQAAATYRKALSGATDKDQVEAIVKPLRKLGEKVDLPRHFGFLTNWHSIGLFDNTDRNGLDTVYPPEEKIDLTAKYPGKEGEVAWTPMETKDDYGVVDFRKVFKSYGDALMYATAEYNSPTTRDVEFRLGTPNAWKLWLNGKEIFRRDEYHRGKAIDQYRIPVRLRAGKNVILLKICQNEQTEDWAQDFEFQLRVCDASGIAVLSAPPQTTTQVD